YACSPLSLHDALPIFTCSYVTRLGSGILYFLLAFEQAQRNVAEALVDTVSDPVQPWVLPWGQSVIDVLVLVVVEGPSEGHEVQRSEEHTSELQSRENL